MFKHFLKGLTVLGCVALTVPAWAADGDNSTSTPSETKFYRIKSAYSGFTATKMIYANGQNMSWKTVDADDPSFIWLFTPGSADNKFHLISAYTGLYQQTQNSDSQPFMLGATATEVTITPIADTNQIYMTNGRAVHAGSWSGGNMGNVLGWQTTGAANSASSWYIESIDNDDVVIEKLKEHYLSAIAHLSAANQAKFAAQVAVINNNASTPKQIVDAYVAIAEKLPSVFSVTPVTSEAMLQSGGKYVVGVVGVNQNVWQPVNPLCYKANADGTTYDFESKPDLVFSPDFIWTANVNDAYTCANTTADHNGSHKVLQLSQEFNGTQKAISIGSGSAKNLAVLTNSTTNIEFVPTSCASFAGECLFQLHVDPTASTFQRMHAVLPNGNRGYYSKDNNIWLANAGFDLTGANSAAGSSYSGLHRVYMVIDSEDFAGAATAVWNALKEEECALSQSESYIEQVNALPLPDITHYTDASTFVNDLRREFNKELFFLESEYMATVTPATVTYSSGNATGWNHTLLDNKGAFAKIIAHSGTSTGLAANIKKLDDNTFDFRNGGVYRSRYVVECFNPAFSIIGVSFKASTTASGEYVTVDGEDILLTSTPQTIVSTTSTFEFHGANNEVRVTDLKIKYRRTSTVSAIPAESGWYSVLSTHNLTAYAGKWAVNLEKDVKQDATRFYPLAVSDDFSDAPASNLIYIEVSGNNRYVKSANGHYVNENCTASRTRGSVTRFRDYEATTNSMSVGAYWSTYQPTVGGVAYNLIGQTGSASANRWAVFKENPEELYDIWTVNITGAPNASALQDDVRVQCNNAANKGISKVYNGGNFFFTKGATVTANDFVADELADGSKTPVITVNNSTKTVNVNYTTKAELVALYYNTVENGYTAYRNVGLFDSEVIDAVVAEHKAKVDAAAGEDEAISIEEIAAMDAAVVAASFTDGYKQIRVSAAGKLVQFKNLDHATLYLSVAPVEAESYSYRAVGVTDKTDISTLWQIELANAEQGTVYLKNYGTGLWLQNYVRTVANGGEYDIPVAETDPVAFELEAYNVGNPATPVIGFKDTVSANYCYLHQTTNTGNRLVKWNTPVNSHASAWSVMAADDDEISDTFEVSFDKTVENGHIMVLSHANGVSLHEAYCDAHHSIVIRKAASEMRKVQARDGESEGDIIISPDKLSYDDAEGTVSFPINENGQLEVGQSYVATIPAGIVKIGSDKVSKATTHTFTYNNDTTTGIEVVEDASADKVIYDLQGRQLTKASHGVNIVNGHKVVVK